MKMLSAGLLVTLVACEALQPERAFTATCYGKESKVMASTFAVMSEGCVTFYNSLDRVVSWSCGCSSVVRVP